MSLTLEDFLRITNEREEKLKKQREIDQEEQVRQRSEDEKIRAKEREDHLAAISTLIETGVSAEVKKVFEPVQKINEERIGKLESELSEIKALMNTFNQI